MALSSAERTRRYRERHPERVAATQKRYAATPEGRERLRAIWRARVKRDRKKFMARSAVRAAVVAGTLVRGPCEHASPDCVRTEGHHDDYDKPLAVRWLCRYHHRKEHHSGK